MPPRHILLALCVATTFGLSFIAISWGVDEVPPLLLTALRYTFAALPAVFFVRRPQVDWRLILGYGFAIGVGQFGLLFVAIALGAPAGLSSLVIQLQVFFTIFLAFLVFGERPTPPQILGASIAFLGIAAIGLERLEGAALVPMLLVVAAAVCWGLGNIVNKRAGKIDMLGFVAWSALVPPVPLFVLSLLLEGPQAMLGSLDHITWRGIGSITFMAYGATLFGFGAWAFLLSRYRASQVTPFGLFIPVAGIGASMLLLGEAVSILEVVGSALVFFGLVVNVFGQRFLGRRIERMGS